MEAQKGRSRWLDIVPSDPGIQLPADPVDHFGHAFEGRDGSNAHVDQFRSRVNFRFADGRHLYSNNNYKDGCAKDPTEWII